MILESCRRAAPRAAKVGVRTALGAVGCFCWLATVSIDARGLVHVGGVMAEAAGDAQRARELFRQGSVFFDSGQFGKAIEAWQRAYEEKQDPGLLYNIGQAYRLAGDPRKALFFYRSFLRKTPRTAREREDAEQKIGVLEAQIAAEAEKADQKAPVAASAGQPGPAPLPSAPAPEPAAEQALTAGPAPAS
ncbi:MAG TPA: tetratricopeptide repeat protein, partial [Polyangia bacterium]